MFAYSGWCVGAGGGGGRDTLSIEKQFITHKKTMGLREKKPLLSK